MKGFDLKNTTRITIVLAIGMAFFCGEISTGFRSRSLALIADAFHYFNDVVAYAITLAAAYLKESKRRPRHFTFAFHRAELIGAFFNGIFLMALALSIFLQSIERFINVEHVNDPMSVIIVGGIGLVLNIISACIMHDNHGHHAGSNVTLVESKTTEPPKHVEEVIDNALEEGDVHALHNHVRLSQPAMSSKNLGMTGMLLHILGDAVNNVGVILAGVIMLKSTSPARFYADPAISLLISFIIFASAIPLAITSGRIFLEAAPPHMDLSMITQDLVSLPGVVSIHDLHVWHLSQNTYLASFHALVSPTTTIEQWGKINSNLRKCMAEYGIVHATVGPESSVLRPESDGEFKLNCSSQFVCG